MYLSFQLRPRDFFCFALCLAFVFLPARLPAQRVAPSVSPTPDAAASPAAIPVTAAAPSDQTVSYVLRVNDLIRVAVFQEDDLTTEARISKSGTITLPLLGPVSVEGKTIAEAIADIHDRLDRDYIINPQVTLSVLEYAQQSVTVLGEVQKPGQVQIPPEGGLDLLGAIALAGGYTRVADPSRVIIRRMVNGHDVVLQADAKRLAQDAHVQPFFVQPGDRINVAESIW
jgi:polysaccharide export outer membrane protein